MTEAPWDKKCPFCDYEWVARVDDPKSCPRCKHRMDSEWKKLDTS